MPKPFTTERVGKRGTSYRVTYWDGSGAQRLRTFKSKKLAGDYARWRGLEPAADDLAFDLKYGAGAPPAPTARPKAPTVYDFWQVIKAGDAHSAHRTAAADSVFRNQLEPFHGRRLDAITEAEVRAWLATSLTAVKTLKSDPDKIVPKWSPRTVSDALAELRRIYRAAVSAGHVKADNDPAARVRMPQRAKARARRAVAESDVYTPAELDAILKVIPRRWKALFMVLADTGARLSEVGGLAAAHFDPEATGREITLGAQVTEEVKGPIRLRDFAKSDASTGRVTWLMPETIAAIKDHLVDYPNHATTATMFRTEIGAIPNRSNLNRVWRAAVTTAGVRYLPIRNLRHTAASYMIAAKLDLAEVAARLGHANPQITLSIYTRFIARSDNSSAARVAAWRDGQR